MSTLLTKTTRKGKTIAVTLTQDDDRDQISIKVDDEPVELDEEATTGRPLSMGPKLEKDMGLEPRAVSFGTAALTAREYAAMNRAWSEQSPRYRADVAYNLAEPPSPRLKTGTPVRTLPHLAEDGPSLPQQGTVG